MLGLLSRKQALCTSSVMIMTKTAREMALSNKAGKFGAKPRRHQNSIVTMCFRLRAVPPSLSFVDLRSSRAERAEVQLANFRLLQFPLDRASRSLTRSTKERKRDCSQSNCALAT